MAEYFKRKGASDAEAEERASDMISLLSPGRGLLGVAAAGALVDNWWLFLLRGLLALVFGALTIWQPTTALGALVLVFGVWAFIDGIDALALAVTGWRSWQMVVAGLVGLGIGLLTFFRPGVTAIGLYAAIAAWAIARGVMEIAVAIQLRKVVQGEAWLVLGGITSLLFGVLMIALPVAGVLALAWLIGIYAFTFGFVMCMLAAKLWRLKQPRHGVVVTPPTAQPA
jgi:uncharacterized membrane protein HdeD (DUF308 family)